MYKNPVGSRCKISTCSLYESASWKKVFKPVTINIYKSLYYSLPENTIAEKILKIRKMNNLERKDLGKILGLHHDTIVQWELFDVMPKPLNIKLICNKFNLPLSYFNEYYHVYFNNPGTLIRAWKDKNKYTYPQCCSIFNISHSGFVRIINNKIALSYEMYCKMKTAGVF